MKTEMIDSSQCRLLNIKETSLFLGVSVNTLYAWVNQKKIPRIKLGRLVKFDRIELERWLKEKRD